MADDLHGEQTSLGFEQNVLRLVEMAALGHSAVRIGRYDEAGSLAETVAIEQGLLTRQDILPPVAGYGWRLLHPTSLGLALVNEHRVRNGQEAIVAEDQYFRAVGRTALPTQGSESER
jgi:hypothetical protein